MLFVSLVLSFSKFIHIRTFLSLSIGSFNFSRRGSWRGIWNYCWFIFISCLQFGSVAVKHDSSIAAFTMADGLDPSGLSWDRNGAHSSVFHVITQLGTWLRTPWGVDCTVLAKADWQAPEQTMKSQSPFTWKKASTSIKGQRRALEQSDIGFRRAVAVRLLRLSMSTQRGGSVSALRQTRLLLAKYFQILTSSEAASALAVAVSAKPLQHQASCFRLSKLLWLVLTLFRLLTLKLHYLLWINPKPNRKKT